MQSRTLPSDPGGTVADPPFDEAGPLDGMVGRIDDLEEAPSVAEPESVLQVFVSGDSVSGARALGLADDLERLVLEFDGRGPSTDAKQGRQNEKRRRADEDDDIQVTVHGLALEPDAKAELLRRIRALVQERPTADDAER